MFDQELITGFLIAIAIGFMSLTMIRNQKGNNH